MFKKEIFRILSELDFADIDAESLYDFKLEEFKKYFVKCDYDTDQRDQKYFNDWN